MRFWIFMPRWHSYWCVLKLRLGTHEYPSILYIFHDLTPKPTETLNLQILSFFCDKKTHQKLTFFTFSFVATNYHLYVINTYSLLIYFHNRPYRPIFTPHKRHCGHKISLFLTSNQHTVKKTPLNLLKLSSI
jgi:hypothetical protein